MHACNGHRTFLRTDALELGRQRAIQQVIDHSLLISAIGRQAGCQEVGAVLALRQHALDVDDLQCCCLIRLLA